MRYSVEFLIAKQVIATTEVEAATSQDALMKAAEIIKVQVKKDYSNGKTTRNRKENALVG